MKFLLVLAAVGLAAAEPEADPAFAYSFGHAPLVYSAAVHAPVVHTPLTYLAAAGCRNDAGALVPCAHGALPYAAYPYGVLPVVAPAAAAEAAADEPAVEEAARKKREADADADAAVLASSTVVKNPSPYLIHNAPLVHTYAAALPAVHHAYAPYTYVNPYAVGSYIYGRKKREAEAEAEAEADPWLVYGYGHGYPYAHHAFYTPYYHLAGGCRNYLGSLVPCAGRR